MLQAHSPMQSRWRWPWLALLGLLLMACNTTAETPARTGDGERIIIAFTSDRTPDDDTTLQELAHAGGMPLHYVAPVGPRTHVYMTDTALDTSALQQLLTRLGSAAFIHYAEADRRVPPATP